MEIDNRLPLEGRPTNLSEAKNFSGGGHSTEPPPEALRVSTSPQGGGDAIVQIARSWIGTPYVHQASVKGVGCDCLGLLRGVWRELRGQEPEIAPPYSPDWAEATGEETLYSALKRHLVEIDPRDLSPGDVALFRMVPIGPAKHCGIIGNGARAATFPPPFTGEVARSDGGGERRCAPTASLVKNSLSTSSVNGGGKLTLIHARQNKRVSEEMFPALWQRKLAYGFRLCFLSCKRSELI